MTVTAAPFVAKTAQDEDAVSEFISALILSGQYLPGTYGITDEAIRRHRKVHRFALDHQQAAGCAPAPELIARKFPTFPFVDDIPVEWAADQLRREHLKVRLSFTVSEASQMLINDDPMGAYGLLSERLREITPENAQPRNAFDAELMLETPADPIPVGVPALQEATGGIRPSELWYVGARPGRGKSWDLIRHSIAAADYGVDVAIFSLEMNAKDLSDRIQAVLWGWDTVLEWSPERRLEAAEKWSASRGAISIYDPSMIRCDTMAVAGAAKENTLLIVDHVGLMRSASGQRSIEDYRIASMISNELKEIATQFKVPVLAASQLNRKSEQHSAPSLTDLAQTDAAGQDADLVYSIFSMPGSRVQQDTLVKFRRGQAGTRWYTDFRPHLPSFEEISRLQARTILEQESGMIDLL